MTSQCPERLSMFPKDTQWLSYEAWIRAPAAGPGGYSQNQCTYQSRKDNLSVTGESQYFLPRRKNEKKIICATRRENQMWKYLSFPNRWAELLLALQHDLRSGLTVFKGLRGRYWGGATPAFESARPFPHTLNWEPLVKPLITFQVEASQLPTAVSTVLLTDKNVL